MRRLSAFAFAFALAATVRSSAALAYCRSSVCANGVEGDLCVPAGSGQTPDCGKPLIWRQPCVSFTVQKNASNQVSYELAQQTFAAALATWTSAACSDGTPSIKLEDFGAVDCTRVEYNQHAGNANILIFRDSGWPYKTGSDSSTDTIALTTVTYDTDSGQIYDADIEVNTATYTFSTDGTGTATDLLSVLTHESGHFLGLAHSGTSDATMYAYYGGGTSLRTLDDDDVNAICAVYPPGRQAEGACTGLPLHGFAPECADQQTEGHCAFSPASEGSTAFGVAIALLGLSAARRRRSRVCS